MAILANREAYKYSVHDKYAQAQSRTHNVRVKAITVIILLFATTFGCDSDYFYKMDLHKKEHENFAYYLNF